MSKPSKDGLPNIQTVCARAAFFLQQQNIKTPKLEAEILLASVLGCDRTQLMIRAHDAVSKEQEQALMQLINKRAEHTPLHYLTRQKEFMGRDFLVTEDVLIPRDDTEVLVHQALAFLKQFEAPRVLDLGTGSGIVAITLKKEMPMLKMLASDLSSEALCVAMDNAKRHGAEVVFLQSDLFAAFLNKEQMMFQAIVSNPPYVAVSEQDSLPKDVQQEPALALFGGDDGLDYYRRIVAKAGRFLLPGGKLFLEIGCQQAQRVVDLMIEQGFTEVCVQKDLAGLDRVVFGLWRCE